MRVRVHGGRFARVGLWPACPGHTVTVKPRVCKEAGDNRQHAKRPAPHPGPRCTTCHRKKLAEVRQRNRERKVLERFHLTSEVRQAILDAQGGVCPICERAREASASRRGGRRLATDHDHACCPGPTSCGECVRGLLCGRCNDVLAHFRDDPEAFLRGAAYLRHPPAQAVILSLDG